MNYNALKAELTDDPLARGYSGMTDAQVIASLHTKDRSRNRTTMSGSEVLNAIDAGEWATRSADEKRLVFDVVHIGTVNPFGVEGTLMTEAFNGSGGVTIAALVVARVELIHRATELGLGTVKEGHVQKVRA